MILHFSIYYAPYLRNGGDNCISRGSLEEQNPLNEFIRSAYIEIATAAVSHLRNWEPRHCSVLEAGCLKIILWLLRSREFTESCCLNQHWKHCINQMNQLGGKREEHVRKMQTSFLLPWPFFLGFYSNVPPTFLVGQLRQSGQFLSWALFFRWF